MRECLNCPSAERNILTIIFFFLLSKSFRRKFLIKLIQKILNLQPSDTSNLQTGQRVEHPKFGFGHVTKLETVSGSTKAVIEFEEVGEKTLLLSFAKLRVLG